MPTRNHYGIIGPIPKEEFDWKTIQKKIDNNPFILDKKAKPRVLTITQSTYDGVLYNVETIKEMLDGKVDTLHFDEAWLPHATFHDFYKDMHAIGKDRPRSKESMVFSSTLKREHGFLYAINAQVVSGSIAGIANFGTRLRVQ
ncbi:MAG: hypothetical protein RIR50_350 [Pseudomonadota bacterium]